MTERPQPVRIVKRPYKRPALERFGDLGGAREPCCSGDGTKAGHEPGCHNPRPRG